jgi:hypothetical protein
VLFVDVSQSKLGTGGDGFAYLLVGLGIGGVLAATGSTASRSPGGSAARLWPA